jgi:hypothetical protein
VCDQIVGTYKWYFSKDTYQTKLPEYVMTQLLQKFKNVLYQNIVSTDYHSRYDTAQPVESKVGARLTARR